MHISAHPFIIAPLGAATVSHARDRWDSFLPSISQRGLTAVKGQPENGCKRNITNITNILHFLTPSLRPDIKSFKCWERE